METIYIQMALATFSMVASAIVAWVGRKLHQRSKEQDELEESHKQERDALREGVRAILRDRMLQITEIAINQNYTQVYMIENMAHMYNAYKQLGGNGAMSTIYEQFMSLPRQKQENLS